MPKFADHPAVKKFYEKEKPAPTIPAKLDSGELKQLCIGFGADDVGFADIWSEDLKEYREAIIEVLPKAKSAIVFACRINKEHIRTPARSVSNIGFHGTYEHMRQIVWKMVSKLESKGIWAIGFPGHFPLEMERIQEKNGWIVSLKPLAVAAGLGQMGKHRMVIHPKFGAFVYLSAIITDRDISSYGSPSSYSPCLECGLCSATCPTGAIAPDGYFNMTSCLTHNYREKIGGFNDWVETIADSKNRLDYRQRVGDADTRSIWQGLAYQSNTKCDFCMAVCPAGENIIGSFLSDKKKHIEEIVKPLQELKETVYVVSGSDAEASVTKRFPNKKPKQVSNGMRPPNIKTLLGVLPHAFNRNQSEGLNARYHFIFTGEEKDKVTVVIKDKTMKVEKGLLGKSDIQITADSRTWIKFLAKEKNIIWALLTRKIKIKGTFALLPKFGKCFPS